MSRARLNADHYAGSTDASVLSGVLPVGVTGGSGLTALGTVATGNLSNSDIVYPTGHVLQTIFDTHTTYRSGNGWIEATADEITLSSDSNKLLVIAHVMGSIEGTSVNYGGIKLVSSGTGVSAETHETTRRDSTGSYGLRLTEHSGVLIGRGLPWIISFLFSPSESSNPVTIKAYMGGRVTASQGTINVNSSGASNSDISTMTLMEIAQ